LNGAAEASQGSFFHVVECTCVYNGEIGVRSGSDGVIQSKANYSELVDKDLGEVEE
jgi:hypothetical protein